MALEQVGLHSFRNHNSEGQVDFERNGRDTAIPDREHFGTQTHIPRAENLILNVTSETETEVTFADHKGFTLGEKEATLLRNTLFSFLV